MYNSQITASLLFVTKLNFIKPGCKLEGRLDFYINSCDKDLNVVHVPRSQEQKLNGGKHWGAVM